MKSDVNIFLFLKLFIVANLEATLLAKSLDTALGMGVKKSFTESDTLLHKQRVSPIIGW